MPADVETDTLNDLQTTYDVTELTRQKQKLAYLLIFGDCEIFGFLFCWISYVHVHRGSAE